MEQFNALVIALLFVLLIGGWLLANALVDVSARRFRQWIGARGQWGNEHESVSTSDSLGGSSVEHHIRPS